MSTVNDKANSLVAIPPKTINISSSGHVLSSLDTASENKDLYSWGRNYDSELGNGKKGSVSTPGPLTLPNGERLMLRKKKAKKVLDLHGSVWGKNIRVEQAVAVGQNSSAVYWRTV
jgi:alpha-tubulin suppressor-like RCC1 family protein